MRSSQLQLRPCAVFPEVHYSALRGNQWGDKLLWTATPFICCVVVCMPGCRSKHVCARIWMCVCISLASKYKYAAFPIYDNWMLWSICVLPVYFLLVALMACYLSKPVFKRLLMGVHMHHPLTHSAALFFYLALTVWRSFSRLFVLCQAPVISEDVWCLMSADSLQCIGRHM